MSNFKRYFKNPDCLPDDGEELLQEAADSIRTGLILLGISTAALLILWWIEPVLMVLALILGFHFVVGGLAAVWDSLVKLIKYHAN